MPAAKKANEGTTKKAATKKTASKTTTKTSTKTKANDSKTAATKTTAAKEVKTNNKKVAKVNDNKNAKKTSTKNKVKAKNVTKAIPAAASDKKPEEPRDISFYFPKTKNMNKLKMIDRQVVTKPEDAEAITAIIKEYVKTPGTKVITDATAGLGGTTINFANNFKSVNAVEVDKNVFEGLKNNVGVYGLKNVELINKDYLAVAKDLKQDVIFIDAPWSDGKKKHKLARLQLGEKFLTDILNELKGKAEYFVFTAPTNFDYGYFLRGSIYKNVDVRLVPNRMWKVVVVYL